MVYNFFQQSFYDVQKRPLGIKNAFILKGFFIRFDI